MLVADILCFVMKIASLSFCILFVNTPLAKIQLKMMLFTFGECLRRIGK